MSFRVEAKELFDKMGVGYVLGPYETFPWSAYDSEKGITCSAEVRMGGDSREADAEVQMLYDTPPEGKPPMELVCMMHCAPDSDNLWTVTNLRIHGEPFGEGIYNWQEKACNFLSAVGRALATGEVPDIEELIREEFHGGERFADQQGGGGKAPKINSKALLGMKKGTGF
jgi:hypothetical protein